MFVQTSDRANWQTRYVVQNPFEGDLQSCRSKAATYRCEDSCRTSGGLLDFTERWSAAKCLRSCKANTVNAIEQARRYYEIDLPKRQQTELQTLMRYTGWNNNQAKQFIDNPLAMNDIPISKPPRDKWWKKLFNKNTQSSL
jgi:hypothetical protein